MMISDEARGHRHFRSSLKPLHTSRALQLKKRGVKHSLLVVSQVRKVTGSWDGWDAFHTASQQEGWVSREGDRAHVWEPLGRISSNTMMYWLQLRPSRCRFCCC